MRLCLVLLALGILPALADRPRDGSKPLSEIAKALEDAGHVLSEMSFDDGHWEVDSVKDGKHLDLTVDAKSGEVTRTRADASDDPQPAKEDRPLSTIAQAVEAKGYLVASVDFESAHWDVEAYKGRTEWELTVSKAGEIVSEQED